GAAKRAHFNNKSAVELTPPPDELVPMLPDEGFQVSTVIAGLMPDSFGEMFNFLDGDSFGIGPMHEFVYGWQAIVNTMSMKNNVEVRKRAGLQRFALAGINGITLISHIGVTEIMINGTRSYCFGGVSRPPGRRSVICKVKNKDPLLRRFADVGAGRAFCPRSNKNRVCPSMSAAALAAYTKHTTGRGGQFRTFVLVNSPSLKSAWRELS
ncbi:hypothetical protein evm_015322, partial [Chilo suppressalis]